MKNRSDIIMALLTREEVQALSDAARDQVLYTERMYGPPGARSEQEVKIVRYRKKFFGDLVKRLTNLAA